MGKVITSQGLQDFIQKGTITHVPDHQEAKPAPAAPAEPVAPAPGEPPAPAQASEAPKAPETKEPLAEEGLEDEDKDLSEAIRKKIGKKHRAMKEAQEEAEDAKNWGKTQYQNYLAAEERAAALERQIKEATPPKPAEPELEFPLEDSFVKDGKFDRDAYKKAVTDYSKQEAKKALAEERAAAQTAERRERLSASADQARKAHTDFDDTMRSLEGTQADLVPQFVLNYIEESGNPGELSYYLAKHPEDRERIAKLSPIRGIAELGKLEDKLNKPAETAKPAPAAPVVPERGGAPPPIQPLNTSASGSVNVDPSKMSYKELRAYERERERNKQRK